MQHSFSQFVDECIEFHSDSRGSSSDRVRTDWGVEAQSLLRLYQHWYAKRAGGVTDKNVPTAESAVAALHALAPANVVRTGQSITLPAPWESLSGLLGCRIKPAAWNEVPAAA